MHYVMIKTSARQIDKHCKARFTQAERAALSDERMLESAIKLIVERGTEKTTLKEVGELAGYSRGLAGYRFGSKQGLFSFVVHAISEKWLKELEKVTEGKFGLDAICSATDAHYHFCLDAPVHVRAFYILWFESISPGSKTREIITAIHQRRQRDVIEWINLGVESNSIDTAVNVEAVAAQFCSALVGIVYQWLVNPDSMDEIKELHNGLKCTMETVLKPVSIAELID
ncbi:MAG: TetR/AcrR family transcriptional regulator [Gammaproteobacteria bacterium]|nr:MAG: TetR/AcrR family transcriptional regulator [Gammaproteobacteria bacterium]